MLLRRLLPRYSIRSLLFATLVFSLATQAVVTAKQWQLQRRRDVLISDVQAQVITSQSMELVYAERFLKIVQRRIDAEAAILTDAEQRQLLQLIEREQLNRQLAFAAPR
jgi:hypothetical protein